jgi:prepilin-type N-terminal cleavage/methylation domain-containing protein
MKLNRKDDPPRKTKGFTLIELLIVIAILAVLSVVVILTLNPAELLRQARDSTRVSDMSTYKSAMALYLADVISPRIGTSTLCYAHISSTAGFTNCNLDGRFSLSAVPTFGTSTAINGFGWIPVDFTLISAGSPISVEPIDPTNNATYYYSYRPGAGGTTYKMTVKMESSKYTTGVNNLAATDGGSSTSTYEIGTDLGL